MQNALKRKGKINAQKVRRASHSVIEATWAVVVGLIGFFWYVLVGPMHVTASSVALAFLCFLVAFRFNPISVYSLIFFSVYIPGLAFLWAALHGAEYINYHNHWLQENSYYVNASVHITLCAALLSYGVLTLPPKKKQKKQSTGNINVGVSLPLYITCTLGAGFFFWLTDPAFATILTHNYIYILENRIPHTQFAGGIALIMWLIAFVNYLRLKKHGPIGNKSEQAAQRLFLFVTILSITWLALHARRSELIGMGLVSLISLRERIGLRRSIFIGGAFLFLLVAAGKIRGASLVGIISGDVTSDIRTDIASMPGGASNVFMTLIDALHYFNAHDYFYGETFWNYWLQLAPTPFYQMTGIKIPPYFNDIVYTEYSYNGGNYILSVFLGNFGLAGIVMAGFFLGLYARAAKRLTLSVNLIPKVIGLYMLAMCFRGFWYELITIIKPIFVVLIPGIVIVAAVRKRPIRKAAIH